MNRILPALAAAFLLALPTAAAQTASPAPRTYTAEELVRAMRISEQAGMCSAFRAIRQGLVRITDTGIEVVGSEQQLDAISDACFTDTVEAEGRQP